MPCNSRGLTTRVMLHPRRSPGSGVTTSVRRRRIGHLIAGLILVTAAATAFTAMPPQGSVGPTDGSSTTWTGTVPTPTPASNPVAAENFTPSSTPFKPSNAEAGWTFTVNQPIQITNVGVWDSNGDGLVEDHTVRIYD